MLLVCYPARLGVLLVLDAEANLRLRPVPVDSKRKGLSVLDMLTMLLSASVVVHQHTRAKSVCRLQSHSLKLHPLSLHANQRLLFAKIYLCDDEKNWIWFPRKQPLCLGSEDLKAIDVYRCGIETFSTAFMSQGRIRLYWKIFLMRLRTVWSESAWTIDLPGRPNM